MNHTRPLHVRFVFHNLMGTMGEIESEVERLAELNTPEASLRSLWHLRHDPWTDQNSFPAEVYTLAEKRLAARPAPARTVGELVDQLRCLDPNLPLEAAGGSPFDGLEVVVATIDE